MFENFSSDLRNKIGFIRYSEQNAKEYLSKYFEEYKELLECLLKEMGLDQKVQDRRGNVGYFAIRKQPITYIDPDTPMITVDDKYCRTSEPCYLVFIFKEGAYSVELPELTYSSRSSIEMLIKILNQDFAKTE